MIPDDVLAAWGWQSAELAELTGGLINATSAVRLGGEPIAVIQRLHPAFGAEVNLDIEAITAHLAARGLTTPRLVRTRDGRAWHEHAGQVWRALSWVDGQTVHALGDPAWAEAGGALVGAFHRALADLAHDYAFARAGVHDTPAHLARLSDHVVASKGAPPSAGIDAEAVALGREILDAARGLPDMPDVPGRHCHGDLKISNLLFAAPPAHPVRGVCLVDLDTLGLSTMAFELGDAMRSWCNPHKEDAGRVIFDLYDIEHRKLAEAAAKLDLPPGLNVYSGTPTEFAPRGDRLIVSHEASNQPGDLWIYNLASRHADQLTFSTIASLQATPLPPAQIVHYKSFDGKIISALLWVPFNLKRDGTNPALVMPHGGPTGQTINDWIPDRQALASRGYICIAPNPRGSTGFGLDFQKANYQDLGGGDLKDELGAVEFLKASGYVDPNRIGITGGSYGGYMTLMALGKTPAVWAAGVERYGIIDWSSMLKSSDPALNEYLKSLLGDPEQNHKFYVEDSPITFIRDVKAPLLVLQGDNDPRVPKEEAQQIVDILKKQGRVVEVQYYANEGHGFVKRENQIDAIRRTVDWFEQYLKGNLSATSNQKH